MNPHYPAVSHRGAHRCEYCHAPEAIFNLPFEIEHIIPVSRGGDDDETNLALACRSCNLYKANHVTGVNQAGEDTVRLFHPRQDIWDEHFRAAPMIGSMEGLTEIGAATILRLRMNGDLQLSSRLRWTRAGLFP